MGQKPGSSEGHLDKMFYAPSIVDLEIFKYGAVDSLMHYYVPDIEESEG